MRSLKFALGTVLTVSILGCNNGSQVSGTSIESSASSSVTSYPATGNNLRLSLTDAPSKELKNVFVNVDHAELFVRKGSGVGRIVVGQNLGLIDLLTLRSGVTLPFEDVKLPVGLEITAIRLVLKSNDNHSIKSDDSRCEMQTPSAQHSGIKILLAQSFTIEDGKTYSMVMDFDAAKSVVVKGNGDCLLKPVLRLLSVKSVANPPASGGTGTGGSGSSDASIPAGETPVTEGTDTNGTGGFEDGTTNGTAPSDPAVITVGESFLL